MKRRYVTRIYFCEQLNAFCIDYRTVGTKSWYPMTAVAFESINEARMHIKNLKSTIVKIQVQSFKSTLKIA
jgi:hypothetical protein